MEIFSSEYFLSFVSGALVSALGLYLAHSELDRGRQEKKIKGLHQALYEELKEIRNVYDEEVGVFWKEFKKNGGGEIFPVNLSLTQDYFTVYHSNANLIGQIPNSKLRRRIVKTYTSLKVLIDYYKQNNRVLDELEKRESTEKTVECDPDILDFTKRLHKRHRRFKRLQKKLLKMLEKELSKPSYENPAQTISNLRSSSLTTPRLS